MNQAPVKPDELREMPVRTHSLLSIHIRAGYGPKGQVLVIKCQPTERTPSTRSAGLV